MSAMSEPTHFERLGLPRRFALDVEVIEREYLSRSRALHPDYHVLGSEAERRASEELSSALNEAYSVLRDPFRRAEYLLALEGGPTASEFKEMPQAFLFEMLEQRERIEELKSSRTPCFDGLQELETELTSRRDSLLAEVATLFQNESSGSDRATVFRSIRERLNAIKYLNGLIRDLGMD